MLVLASCGPPEGVSPTTTLQETALGTLLASPFTDAVPIDVEEGALSLTVMAESGGLELLALEVEAPGGKRIVRADDPDASSNFALPGSGLAVAQIPIRPEVELVAGRYFVRALSLGGDADVRLRAFVKIPDDDALDVDSQGQVFDLALLFATSVARPGDAVVDRALSATERTLEVIDLRLADVWGYELDDVRIVTDSDPGLGKLLKQSAGLAEGAIPIFFVDDVQKGGAEVVAFSAGIPLPPIDGTSRSGIVASARFLRTFPGLMGDILAHEIGHATGLFHTTEQGGERHDPLADTPECGVENDRDNDGELSFAECSGGGGDNFMFWSCCGRRISADQRFVVLRSALTR